MTITDAPLEIAGHWADVPTASVEVVATFIRQAVFAGVTIPQTGQPTRLLVENRANDGPSIWLHHSRSETAMVRVRVGRADWCKFAYQFGHELGHVLANSWREDARPATPSQWIEEATAEAFSLSGLGQLASAWSANPPFRGDSAFGEAVRSYRQVAVDRYRSIGERDDGAKGLPLSRLAEQTSLTDDAAPLILALLAEIDGNRASAADIAAMNRWTERSRVPPSDYCAAWRASCLKIGTPSRLPSLVARFVAP